MTEKHTRTLEQTESSLAAAARQSEAEMTAKVGELQAQMTSQAQDLHAQMAAAAERAETNKKLQRKFAALQSNKDAETAARAEME